MELDGVDNYVIGVSRGQKKDRRLVRSLNIGGAAGIELAAVEPKSSTYVTFVPKLCPNGPGYREIRIRCDRD